MLEFIDLHTVVKSTKQMLEFIDLHTGVKSTKQMLEFIDLHTVVNVEKEKEKYFLSKEPSRPIHPLVVMYRCNTKRCFKSRKKREKVF